MEDPKPRMTVEEYLAHEEASQVRHEYHDGVLVAMSGGRRDHNRIRATLEFAIQSHAGDGPCEAHGETFKVRIEAVNKFYYPDVVVDCSPDRDGDQLSTSHAPLIVEVLSDSTEAFDRGDKFRDYRRLPSLREYVLVDSHKVAIDVFRRTDAGIWQIVPSLEHEDTLHLESIDLEMSVREVYDARTNLANAR